MGMRVDIVTLFPEMCQQVLDASIIGRAARRGCIETHCHQIRDYTLNKQKQTDDYPYGGGCGMVLYAQPIADCLRAGQTVVDVGIHVNEEGKLCGDVQFDAAEPVVDAITPVPGGVGTVTTSVLVGHVVQAACKKAGVEC